MLIGEKNHIAILFIIGAIVGALGVWSLARAGTLKIGADLANPDVTYN